MFVKTKALKLFETQLKVYKSKAFPFATRQAVNSYAFDAMGNAKSNAAKDFVLKNKFTARSIRVNQTRSLSISEQASEVGSTLEYMEKQEFGGHRSRKGKHGVPIPTSFAAGQSEQTNPRTKTVRPRFKMSAVRLRASSRAGQSRKQRNAIAIKQAIKSSSKFVYLDLDRTKGIFQITGSKARGGKLKLRMLYYLSKSTVTWKPTPWLAQATKVTERRMDRLYFKALKFQLEKHNLFKKL